MGYTCPLVNYKHPGKLSGKKLLINNFSMVNGELQYFHSDSTPPLSGKILMHAKRFQIDSQNFKNGNEHERGQ